mgnify:FL=1
MEWGLLLFIVFLYILHLRLRATYIKIRREEIIREAVEHIARKRRLDRLYGRDQDENR